MSEIACPVVNTVNRKSLSIVIPAYNEARRLPETIDKLKSYFENDDVEILLVIEKSNDQTAELAQRAVANDSRFLILCNEVQRGKGYAVRCGMLRATGEIIIFMDADLSTPLSEIDNFKNHLSRYPEIDVAIGSRAESRSRVIKRQNMFRQTLGRGFNRFVQYFGVTGIQDTQCGFKAFRKNACAEIFSRQQIDGFAFDVEVLMLANKMGFEIAVLPVAWENSTDSKVRIFIDPLKMLFDLIRIQRLVKQTLEDKPLNQIERSGKVA